MRGHDDQKLGSIFIKVIVAKEILEDRDIAKPGDLAMPCPYGS
jgi:hypothetical protein